MPRSATDRASFGRSYSSEDFQQTDSYEVRPGAAAMSAEGPGGTPAPGRPVSSRIGPKQWSYTALSVLGSAVSVSAVGCLCALIYPILKELRAERVRGDDGTEQRMLAGCACCVFSWSLTYLNSHQPSRESPTHLLKPADIRDISAPGFHMSYGVAVLNGIMAMLTVIWSLT
ncbi:ADP-ribosylation factor-like protein 6-interacting protein 6 isoform X2 [Notolabrus celidotus]|uniref:ADP-ribosylation factor-like protein 6-interacting protein 6 isoform X2 n=1 Tax=Notolabrus celidotus TaxID=1203425 RepID=UPI00148F5EC5|nr:ADP-ribosylation factor-like protein 6-interacting protein 6 isoform X2 [Notolabrus celidotus]